MLGDTVYGFSYDCYRRSLLCEGVKTVKDASHAVRPPRGGQAENACREEGTMPGERRLRGGRRAVQSVTVKRCTIGVLRA
jgi:hypothetical protein